MLATFFMSSCAADVSPSLATADFSSQFLEKVAGFNMTEYRIIFLNVGPATAMPNSVIHYFTPVTVGIVNRENAADFNASFWFIDGKMWEYSLDGEFGEGNLTIDDCLPIASNTIVAYDALLNTSRYDKTYQMLSTAISAKTLTVEDENSSLQLSYVKNCSTPLDYKLYTSLSFAYKIDGVMIPMEGLGLSISKDGLLTSLGDGSVYNVPNATLAISKEEAINMSLPYANTYANQHGQSVTTVNANLIFARDWRCTRSNDDFSIYPLWNVSVTFDRVNEQNVLTYGVAIWADNGQIYINAAQSPGGLSPQQANATGSFWQLTTVIVGILALTLLLVPAAYVFSKKRGRKGR